MRHARKPLQLAAGVDVRRICDQPLPVDQQSADRALDQEVGSVRMKFIRKITLQQMRQHIRDSDCRLVRLEVRRVARVHDCELRDDAVILKAELPLAV